MRFSQVTELSDSQTAQLFALWNNEYPCVLFYDKPEDFIAWLNALTNARHVLLINEAGIISGWSVAFTREQATWFVIIVDSAEQGKGYGKSLFNKLKEQETEINGWVVDHSNYLKSNGQIYLSPIEFYEKNGFTILRDKRLDSAVLSAIQIKWCR